MPRFWIGGRVRFVSKGVDGAVSGRFVPERCGRMARCVGLGLYDWMWCGVCRNPFSSALCSSSCSNCE